MFAVEVNIDSNKTNYLLTNYSVLKVTDCFDETFAISQWGIVGPITTQA